MTSTPPNDFVDQRILHGWFKREPKLGTFDTSFVVS
jgi:hypothetical protein